MPVRIHCPHCSHELRLPDRLYRRRAQCPFCDGAFAVRWPKAAPTETQGRADVNQASGGKDER